MRTGSIMDAMVLYLSVNRGVAPSAVDLARAVHNGLTSRWALKAVERLVSQQLCRIDPSHPRRNPRGRGAVVLTTTGEHYAWTLRRAPQGSAA